MNRQNDRHSQSSAKFPGLWHRIVRALGAKNARDVARRLGISDSSVSDWRRQGQVPSLENLVRIAQLGNTTLDWLLLGGEPGRRELSVSESLFEKISEIAAADGCGVREEIERLLNQGLLAREFARSLIPLMESARTVVARSMTEPPTMHYDLPGGERVHSPLAQQEQSKKKRRSRG